MTPFLSGHSPLPSLPIYCQCAGRVTPVLRAVASLSLPGGQNKNISTGEGPGYATARSQVLEKFLHFQPCFG